MPHLELYIDDIITHKSTWEEFLNGDFESGLDNWITTENVSIDNTIVHGGNNSCKLSGEYSTISQRIDLTNYKQLNIYCNITQCDEEVAFNIVKDGNTITGWYPSTLTNGWFHIKYDVSDLNGIYIIHIISFNSTVYVDDISSQEEYDVQSYFTDFDTSMWFHYVPIGGISYSTILPSGGINDSWCTYLNPRCRPWQMDTASIYYYFDLSNVQILQFWYRAPVFNTNNQNNNYGKLNVKINDTIFNIANATYGGSIPEWTQATVNLSDFSGVCKVEIYGEARDYHGTMPNIEIYIDNVQFINIIPINISQQLYLRHQYDYEMRALDNGMLVDNDLQFSHRLTDKGQFIDFDYEDMKTKGLIRSIKHILNTLYMRIRGIV